MFRHIYVKALKKIILTGIVLLLQYTYVPYSQDIFERVNFQRKLSVGVIPKNIFESQGASYLERFSKMLHYFQKNPSIILM